MPLQDIQYNIYNERKARPLIKKSELP